MNTDSTNDTADLEFARELARASGVASLVTLDPADGPPHASLATVAMTQGGMPLMLLSDLAVHTANLLADPAAALLMTGEGRTVTEAADDPLAGDRVSVRGLIEKTADPADRARFLARHPSAEMYAEFGDFHFYRMTVQNAHLVGGFGRIRMFSGADWITDTTAATDLIEAEAEIVAHMNEDHADAVALYATALLGRDAGSWAMTGIDPAGADLRNGAQVARLPFPSAVHTPEVAREILVRLVREARDGAEAASQT